MTTVRIVDVEIIRKGNVLTSLTELHRLSYLVRKIDFECAVVPYPSHKTTLTGELILSHGFNGLKPEELAVMQSYRHYREADEETRLKIFVESDKKAVNTLESLDKDIPKHCWSIVLDHSKLVAFVRNFKWPGFLGYARANTNVYGFCYFGDGRCVKDLVFTN
jgi:hypothetical protein